jgi:predicted SnoaL-like aldol condensation-catalyzing enzyme
MLNPLSQGDAWSVSTENKVTQAIEEKNKAFEAFETLFNKRDYAAAERRRKPMSETNKDIAVAFYKKALFEGRVEDAFRLYAAHPYRQHNPLIEDGMEGVKKFVTRIMSNHPDARGEIKRVFADGDHVILHSHWHGLSDNPRGEAVVDIFRLEGGKVLEHWDVIQPIPETSANANTMF